VIVLKSAGKGQVLTGQLNADLYIDCRGMINPFRDPDLGHLTGDDPKVQDWIKQNNSAYVGACLDQILTAVQSSASRNSFKRAPEKPLTVCFFCMAGVHRSRGMKHVVGEILKASGVGEVVVQ
jgi:RNase adaptor protein for sRNA GlmZ degradation